MLKTKLTSLNNNYPISMLMGLVFSISLSHTYAQASLVPTPLTQTNSNTDNDSYNKELGQISKDVLEKARAIQSSDSPIEDKNRALAELGAKYPQILQSKYYFSPKTIPTQFIQRIEDFYGEESKTFLDNIVVLNPAIAIDYNIYIDTERFSKFQEISKTFVFDEKSALVWVLPDLALMKKYLKCTNEQLAQSALLYFKNKPELYNFIPIEFQKMLQSPDEISNLIILQQNYFSKLKF